MVVVWRLCDECVVVQSWFSSGCQTPTTTRNIVLYARTAAVLMPAFAQSSNVCDCGVIILYKHNYI